MTSADRPGPASVGCATPLVALLVVIVLAAGAAAGVLLLLRPHLVFTNRLLAPVRLTVADAPARTVAPSATVRVGLARGATLVATWELVRPLSANDRPMGEELRGSIVLRGPRGTMRAEATSRPAGTAYFAPLITNASSRTLRVAVNAGLQSAVDCGCAVRPGGRRVFIGYYRLFQNSTVRAYDANGSASFHDLGSEVRANGSVGLRFEDKDLRGP
jgi:hypothetical protein